MKKTHDVLKSNSTYINKINKNLDFSNISFRSRELERQKKLEQKGKKKLACVLTQSDEPVRDQQGWFVRVTSFDCTV